MRSLLYSSRAETSVLLAGPLAYFTLVLGIPLVSLVVVALSGEGIAFAAIFAMPSFVSALVRTLVMALIVSVLVSVLGTLYAWGTAIAPMWLRIVLMAWLLLSLWTSVLVRSIGWMLIEIPNGAIYWALSTLGLRDEPVQLYQTALAMYPAMIAVMLPFVVLPVLAAFGSIEREQLVAARVFGAGPILTARDVVFPAIGPSIFSGAILVFVMSLGFYVTPLLLGGPSNMTVSNVISNQLNVANRPDLAAAMSILLVAATVTIYMIADRLFGVSERWAR